MNFEELKEKIAKPHKSYESVDVKLSNFDNFKDLKSGIGVYAISAVINKIKNEEVLKCIEKNSTQKNVIYIGNVRTANIFNRCHQEINGTAPATFFRKIGSVLGYKSTNRNNSPIKNNFVFEKDDKNKIKKWNHTNLRLKIFDTDSSNEEALIRHFKPPFNEEYNSVYTCDEINVLRDKNKGLGE
tara:strand:+ start:57 stop:611 length:555 start_codon:yes stop_codon:yes gene_type:complete